MADPTASDYIISQGDTLPVMEVDIPRNSAGELIDLTGCTVTFFGRKASERTDPPPIARAIEGFDVEAEKVIVRVHFEEGDTRNIAMTGTATYVEMAGELEVVDADGERLTIPSEGYLRWFIRDDIGGVA